MKFLKCTDEHIKESAGWKIFQMRTPVEWIIREVTERDYGIDVYIELVTSSGEVSGNLCSVQLKASERVKWENDTAKYSGISKSTVNYWMNLPVPTFLMLVDLNESKLYFCSVKEQVRKKYSSFNNTKQNTMSLDFNKSIELGTDIGRVIFLLLYFREKEYNQFVNYLREILIHNEEYHNFIVGNQGRDFFLQVEEERQLILIHLYNCCKFLADYFSIKWDVIGLSEAFKKDQETWKDPFCLVHKVTLSKILEKLEIVFLEILNKAKLMVTEEQKDYWEIDNWPLFSMCNSLNIDRLKNFRPVQ